MLATHGNTEATHVLLLDSRENYEEQYHYLKQNPKSNRIKYSFIEVQKDGTVEDKATFAEKFKEETPTLILLSLTLLLPLFSILWYFF